MRIADEEIPYLYLRAFIDKNYGAIFNDLSKMEFISNYAPILEDLSIVVDSSLPVNTFASFILETGKPLLRNISLFDVYEGDQMESGKKSLSYSLVFQAKDKTLTDKEVEKIRKKIIKKLEEKFKVTLRV